MDGASVERSGATDSTAALFSKRKLKIGFESTAVPIVNGIDIIAVSFNAPNIVKSSSCLLFWALAADIAGAMAVDIGYINAVGR